MSKALVVFSGGLDSTILLYLLKKEYGAKNLTALSFNYKQTHQRELMAATAISRALNINHLTVPLDFSLMRESRSALLDTSVAIPRGHYADKTMQQTVVPNRNAIMLSLAAGIAVSRKVYRIATGVHAGDHPIYADCRPRFIAALQETFRFSFHGQGPDLPGDLDQADFHILTPFLSKSKTDIVRMGASLDVPMGDTWSCYVGRTFHCGMCGTCVERREAFQDAGVPDPTRYAETGPLPTKAGG